MTDLNQLEIEEKKLDIEKRKEEWNTCCSKTNSKCLQFAVQSVITGGVLLFSMCMISLDRPSKEVWFSLLSMCVGVYIPQPTPH